MSDKCVECNLEMLWSSAERVTRLCTHCATRLGVVPMPPARRRFAPCRCCNGMSFIRAIPRVVPTMLTIGAKDVLEMYVCRACGYIDWYCNDPEAIRIGPELMTELVEGQESGPYR